MSAAPALVIGLTGGIGSGKSAAADRFAAHGI
ncbi:MAG: dephospho-CoA kinase, partial [Betaproteobacteria bacterium HGW-Betaproteobacteria-21]